MACVAPNDGAQKLPMPAVIIYIRVQSHNIPYIELNLFSGSFGYDSWNEQRIRGLVSVTPTPPNITSSTPQSSHSRSQVPYNSIIPDTLYGFGN